MRKIERYPDFNRLSKRLALSGAFCLLNRCWLLYSMLDKIFMIPWFDAPIPPSYNPNKFPLTPLSAPLLVSVPAGMVLLMKRR
jgi:hypothetical protein